MRARRQLADASVGLTVDLKRVRSNARCRFWNPLCGVILSDATVDMLCYPTLLFQTCAILFWREKNGDSLSGLVQVKSKEAHVLVSIT
jgi:hypothetical protein